MKRPNLQIMGIEQGKEIQTKGTDNLFNRIIADNFPNLKERVTQEQEVYRTPNHQDQKRNTPHTHHNKNTQHTEQRILKAAKQKRQVTYKGKPISKFLNYNSKCKKVMERHNPGLERKQLSTQTSLPSKIIHPN
jgi:hypothetical protein